MQTAEGKPLLFVGIDRTARFAVAQCVATADRMTARQLLRHMLEALPYQVHAVLTVRAIGTPSVRETTVRGIQFAKQPRNRNAFYSRPVRFDMICEVEQPLCHRSERPWRGGIEHRLTKPNHPWTNGQVERVNRTIKDATVKHFHCDSHDQLQTHLADFMSAYSFARPS